MDVLAEIYPEMSVETFSLKTIYKLLIKDRTYIIEHNHINNNIQITDNQGIEYDESIYLENTLNVADATMKFLHDQHVVAGFNVDEEVDLDIPKFNRWTDLIKQIKPNVLRILNIETYGNMFKQYKNYTRVQKRFNALVICSSKPKDVDLHHARGTDPAIQRSVSSGKRFWEVIERIVTTVEKEDLSCIGIYCRAGHHRSVACAELLKMHVYHNSQIKHLTLNR